MGIPAQQAAKITRPLMPSAAPAVLLHSLHTQQGVCNIVIAMTRRDFVKPAFSLRKKRFVKTHALSLLGTTRLLSRSGSCVGRACFLCPTFPRSNTAKALRFIQHLMPKCRATIKLLPDLQGWFPRIALIVMHKFVKACHSGIDCRNPGYMDVFKFTIPSTGYPLPGGYDELRTYLCITMSAARGNLMKRSHNKIRHASLFVTVKILIAFHKPPHFQLL